MSETAPPAQPRDRPLLALDRLTVDYPSAGGVNRAVQSVSLTVAPGEIFGLVGESGSGKSSIGYAVIGHLGAGRQGGGIRFGDIDLTRLSRREWRQIRGRHIGMVYQEPQSALNPAISVGEQISESLRHHLAFSHAAAKRAAIDWLGRVHLPTPEAVYHRYPHQLSGGQLQRAVIAMTFAPGPQLVIMDEPTTGLDVTTQSKILALLADLRATTNVALLYISHDLGVVADLCERVAVMHRGLVVEEGPAAAVLAGPTAPYTRQLVAAIPNLYRRQSFAGSGDGGPRFLDPLPRTRRDSRTLLEIDRLTKVYRAHGRETVACDSVSLDVRVGECVALIGESGSGKSTIAKCVLGLEAPTGGAIRLDGAPLEPGVHRRSLGVRRRVQIVFQNPEASLNPRRSVGETLIRPLLIHRHAATKAEAARQAARLLADVNLSETYLGRYPHELSGGEKQRVAIARALACRPDLIVFDEAVSALDVSVQANVLELCRRLQADAGVAMLFVTHDLGVVRQIAERAVVLRAGRVRHSGDVDSLFEPDADPYVRELIASVPGRRLEASAQVRDATLPDRPR